MDQFFFSFVAAFKSLAIKNPLNEGWWKVKQKLVHYWELGEMFLLISASEEALIMRCISECHRRNVAREVWHSAKSAAAGLSVIRDSPYKGVKNPNEIDARVDSELSTSKTVQRHKLAILYTVHALCIRALNF